MALSAVSLSISATWAGNPSWAAARDSEESGSDLQSDGNGEPKTTAKWQLTTEKITNLSIWAYPKATLLYNGEVLNSDARIINGTTYVAHRSFINETTKMTVSYNSQTKTLTVKGGGLDLSVTDGSNVIYANGRTLFTMTPAVIMNNGRMYIPYRPLYVP